MALFSVPQLKVIAGARIPVQLYAKKSLQEAQKFSEEEVFDIFLSHKFSDLEVALGLKSIFQQYGYNVYVDSEIDRQLDRVSATKTNASLLKNRMRHCKCLIVATSENFQESVWIPWEVGYFDGRGGLVAVAPVTAAKKGENTFKGREYFGLYPYVAEDGIDGQPGKKQLWVFEHKDRYASFKEWLAKKPFRDRPKPPVKRPAAPLLKNRLRSTRRPIR
jgi:hypothetical protein